MYRRSVYPDDEKFRLPDNYGGTAFSPPEDAAGDLPPDVTASEPVFRSVPQTDPPTGEPRRGKNAWEDPPAPIPPGEASPGRNPWETPLPPPPGEAPLGRNPWESPPPPPPPSGLGSLFRDLTFPLRLSFGNRQFDTEDLLILGIALFLLLSGSGDRSCALLLLALLLIK